MQLESFQIKNCFGFGDSGKIKLSNPHNMVYVLGRNSSGKTSLLNGIRYFEHNLKPQDYPNFLNFRPTRENPRLLAEFSIEDKDLAMEHVVTRIRERFERSVPQDTLEEDKRIGDLLEEVEGRYQQLIGDVVQQGHVWVERVGNGTYRFLTSPQDDEDYQARRDAISGLLAPMFQSPRSYVYANTGYDVDLNFDAIEGFLFLQFPRIILFGEYYSLSASLPKRVTRESLQGEKNPVAEAFLTYLGSDTIGQLLDSQDPEERDSLLRQLQDRVDALCSKVNRHQDTGFGNKDLLSIRLHENFGLQITVKTDGKNSYYDQISDATKLLLAYHVHHEAENIAGDVLLFDEPNTGFHPTAQEFVLNFLRSLAEAGNSVVLSTHSEYMIDPDLLAGVRIMTTDANNRLMVKNKFTQATKGKGDYLALQPILDAIGLRYGNLINIKDKVIITEGITDMLYLRAFKKLLKHDARLDVAPVRGDSQILSFIPLLVSQGISFKVVIDTGPVTSVLREDYAIAQEYIYEIPIPMDYTAKMKGSGIEDLFSKDDFRKLCDYAGEHIDTEYEHVTNSFYMRDKPAKSILAHLMYEKSDNMEIEFGEDTLRNFDEVLRFCANDKWCTI